MKTVVETIQNKGIQSKENQPEKKFRAGPISATIWRNKSQKSAESGDVGEYRTISIERSYTDKDGKWQSTNSMRVNDLPKAALVLQRAYEHLVIVNIGA